MESITILGIDPGNHTGVGILRIDPKTYKILAVESNYITLKNHVDNNEIQRLQVLSKFIQDIYFYYKPNIVAMELAFLNMKYPNAVLQLSQYVGTVEYTLYKIDPTLLVTKYAPMFIKAVVAQSGKADKEAMYQGLSNIKEVSDLIDLQNRNEHEIDAIGIAYTALNEIRQYNFMLLAIS